MNRGWQKDNVNAIMKNDEEKFVIYATLCFFVFSDHLNTVALRPTLMYGEADERFFPTIMRLADRWNGKIPRIAEGGKKQLSYVGEFRSILFGRLLSQCEDCKLYLFFLPKHLSVSPQHKTFSGLPHKRVP